MIRIAGSVLVLLALIAVLCIANDALSFSIVGTLTAVLLIVAFGHRCARLDDPARQLILVKAGGGGLVEGAQRQQEIAMPAFDVRFIKTVCDDTGHEHRACQAAFSIEAPSLTEAVRRAEADFCRQKHVHDWTIFADAVEFRSPTALERAWTP